MVSNAIAHASFSGTDQLKVASQYDDFVKQLKELKTPEEKAEHYLQGIKYILTNKSSYWILGANMLKEIMEGDTWKFAVPEKEREKITKKTFFEKILGIPKRTANQYIRIATHYQELGLKEEDVVLLGVKKTRKLITERFIKGRARRCTKKEIEKLRQPTKRIIIKIPRYERVFQLIKKLDKKEQDKLKELLIKEWKL